MHYLCKACRIKPKPAWIKYMACKECGVRPRDTSHKRCQRCARQSNQCAICNERIDTIVYKKNNKGRGS